MIEDVSNIYKKVRQIQVRGAWEIGQRIVEEEQGGEDRAKHNTGLIESLSRELTKRHGAGFSVTTLFHMRRFYLENRKFPHAGNMTWSDHVELMPVKDIKERRHLQERVIKEGLGREKVRSLVRQINRNADIDLKTNAPQLKRPADLILNTCTKSKYTKKVEKDETLVDCGFFFSWPASVEQLKDYVLTDKPSYTYAATVEYVVDGDTLLVLLEVGFGAVLCERLRLCGINTSEKSTLEGDQAKRYVARLLPKGSTIVVKSHKTKIDMYGRFVVDVFFKKDENDPQKIIESGTYLNQHLLDKGHATAL